MHRQQCSL